MSGDSDSQSSLTWWSPTSGRAAYERGSIQPSRRSGSTKLTRWVWRAPFLVGLLLAGCQSPASESGSSDRNAEPDVHRSGEITSSGSAYRAWRAKPRPGTPGKTDGVITEGEIVQLPKFVVQEKGFADYGFSIITNEEVLRGKPVKWVQIGVVIPGSIADQHRLTTGTKIVAIDDMPVTDLIREDLVQLLFEREPGDRVRLLVVSRKFGLLPMFVELGDPPPE